jgi:hypothetical protein
MLSHEALALFRQHIERHGDIEVDDSNRESLSPTSSHSLAICWACRPGSAGRPPRAEGGSPILPDSGFFLMRACERDSSVGVSRQPCTGQNEQKAGLNPRSHSPVGRDVGGGQIDLRRRLRSVD